MRWTVAGTDPTNLWETIESEFCEDTYTSNSITAGMGKLRLKVKIVNSKHTQQA